MKDKIGNTDTVITPETLTQLVTQKYNGGTKTIGLVGNYPDTEETRFLLTPEACGLLTSSGINITMEHNAAIDIDFLDEKYAEYGVKVVTRHQALKADLVLSYSMLKAEDIMRMKKGAVLFTMMDSKVFEKDVINALLEQEISFGCFDNMISQNDQYIFSDILDEIDGRAAIMYAQYALSFLDGGKGVLMSGVAGVMPCEVLIIGHGGRCWAAANAAMSIGASVTLMNNDVSSLQEAKGACGPNLVTASIHPRVLFHRVQSADVIITDTCTRPFDMPRELEIAMKENVYRLDFNKTRPSVCVPRTVAMGLSNVLVNFFQEMIIKDGFKGMLATTVGLQAGMVTYKGNLVDKLVASFTGLPCTDISLLLTGTN